MTDYHHISGETKFLLKFLKIFLRNVEKRENTISLIIQGPLNDRSINTIPKYLKYGQVIVSCWDTCDLSKINKYIDDIDLVINNSAEAKFYSQRTQHKHPIILQNYTTHNALKIAEGYFSIKTRSDESWPDLDALINILKKNRDTKDPRTKIYNDFKIVTSNIYFRYDQEFKFHPSDHIIAGNTSRMKEVFEKTYSDCILRKVKGIGPEELIGKSVISTYRDPLTKQFDIPDPNRSTELMKKHFDIVRISSLSNHTWTSSYRKYAPLQGEEDWCHNINDIAKKFEKN